MCVALPESDGNVEIFCKNKPLCIITTHKDYVHGVKLSLCSTNYALHHEGIGEGMDVQIHVFLISVLVGGEWSASRPGRFIP
jgi:hypothetical protein